MSDIKFDIEVTGIRELKQAADNFQRLGKVSSQLSAQYKPLGAQTTRLVKEQRRLSSVHKSLNKAIKDGVISAKDATRAMQEEIRVSKERILTDKTLIDQAKKRKRAEEETRKETERLTKAYAPARVAADLYKKKVQEIDQAQRRGIISQKEAQQSLSLLTKEYYDFTQGAATGGNQFAKFNVETYKANQRLKRFTSTGLQQAGYQIGDFAVQVQSGTNVAVAFGQQMSQLLGIFGAGGALAGAGVAIGTAFIAPLLDAQREVENLADDMQALFDKLEANKTTAAGLIEGGFAGPLERARQTAIEVLEVFDEIDRRQAKQAFAAGTKGVVEYLDEELQALRIKASGGIAIGGRVAFEGTTTRGREEDPTRRKAAAQLQGDIVRLQILIAEASRLPVDKLAEETVNLFNSLKDNPAASGELLKRYKELLQQSNLFEINARNIAKAQSEEAKQAANRAKSDAEALANAKRLEAERAALREMSRKVSEGVIDLARAELAVMEGINGEQGEANRLAAIAAQERLAGLGMQEAAAKNLSQFLQEKAAKEKKDFDERVKKELDLFEENRRYEERQDALRKRILERQKRINTQAQANLVIEQAKASLLAAQERFGKNSEQARQKELNLAEETVIARETLKGTDETIIRGLVEAAKLQLDIKYSMEDQAAAARELDAALKSASQALNALSGVGDNIEKALVKAKAEVKALKNGIDAANASTIAGFELDLKRKFEEAKEAATGPDGVIAATKEYKESLAELEQLETTLAEKDRLENDAKNSKKVLSNVQATIDKYYEELRLRTILYEQGERVARQEEILAELKRVNKEADIKLSEEEIIAIAKKIEARENELDTLEKIRDRQKEIADDIAGSMGDAFLSIVDGTKSVKDAFRDMARDIIRRLYEILVVEQMVQSIAGSISGGMSLFSGPAPGSSASMLANGGVLSKGSLVPFANGGIVGGPMYFPMSGGRTGLMGEAGPEAIMPLKRGKNGKLGVESNGQGDNIVVNQTFSFAANGDESVKKIIAQQAPKIAQMTQQQIMDSRRRGGQMKAVFG